MFHKQSNNQIHQSAVDGTNLAEIIHPLHHPADPKTSYSLSHVFLKPRKKSQSHRLLKSIETYIIISGHGIITVNNEEEVVSPGSVIVVPKNSAQHIRNSGKKTLEFYCIVSPPWQKDQDVLIEL